MNSTPLPASPIEIVVNGQGRAVPEGMSLQQLLHFLDIDPARVAVELNKAIVRRSAWAGTQIKGGAELEIVQFVGGG